MVEIKDLCKTYNDFTALDHLDLTIQQGELFGFVGPNGAGKTTLLRIISGLLPADGGQVMVGGTNALAGREQLKTKIGYVPDFFGVYDNLRAIEYMEFYASIYGITGEEADRLCMGLLEMFHLEDKAGEMVDSLSRGMKQRLCMARSMVHDPELLILDEPVSGMDPGSRIEMKKLLRALNAMGKTIIVSSHILPELAELCTTVGIIDKGKMVMKGSIEEILHQVSTATPIVLTVAEGKEKAVEILKSTPEVTTISLNEDNIIIGFEGTKEQQASLLKRLVEEQVAVVSYHRKAGDLESVFMRITQK